MHHICYVLQVLNTTFFYILEVLHIPSITSISVAHSTTQFYFTITTCVTFITSVYMVYVLSITCIKHITSATSTTNVGYTLF